MPHKVELIGVGNIFRDVKNDPTAHILVLYAEETIGDDKSFVYIDIAPIPR